MAEASIFDCVAAMCGSIWLGSHDIMSQDREQSLEEVRIEITAGAGGQESQACAAMILRMYLRWCGRHGYTARPGREVRRTEYGIERATIEFSGDGVDKVCSDNGIHRMVRVSPFDAEKRRYTSFVSVHVAPIVEGHMVSPPHCYNSRGMQIRSYVLDQYKMVKDLRTGVQRDDAEAVLDGDIDDFLDAATAAGFTVNRKRDCSAAVMD